MKKSLSIADLMMIGGSAVVFLFSFGPFTSSGPFSANAWSTDFAAFATTVPAILALVMIVWCALEIFGVSLPDQVITFTAPQLKATWAIAAAGILLSWATVDNRAALFWLQLLGGLVMAAGAVAPLLGQLTDPVIKAPTGSSSSTPPAPGQQPPPPSNPQQTPPPPSPPGPGQQPPPPQNPTPPPPQSNG